MKTDEVNDDITNKPKKWEQEENVSIMSFK